MLQLGGRVVVLVEKSRKNDRMILIRILTSSPSLLFASSASFTLVFSLASEAGRGESISWSIVIGYRFNGQKSFLIVTDFDRRDMISSFFF